MFTKKSAKKNTIYEVLAVFTTISFIICACLTRTTIILEWKYLKGILAKSIIIIFAWVFDLYAIKNMQMSLYGVLKLSTIIFSTFFSIILLGEILSLKILLGLIIVIIGLILVNIISNKKDNNKTNFSALIALFAACILNSLSAILDKKLLQNINSNQLQFWFLLFLTILYWLIFIGKREKMHFKTIKKNYWLVVSAICLVFGDRFLFKANQMQDSKVIIMTLIKQFSTIETIILGKFLFKENDILKKLLCSMLIIIGIMITTIFSYDEKLKLSNSNGFLLQTI